MSTQFSFPISAEAAAGNIVVAMLATKTEITPDSRFTVISSGLHGGFYYFLGSRVLVESDLGTHATFTYAASPAGGLVTVENVTDIDRVGFARGTGTELAVSSLNPRGTNDVEVCAWMVNGNVTVLVPPALSGDGYTISPGVISVGMASRTLTSGAQTGPQTATWSGSYDAAAVHLLFRGTAPDVFDSAAGTDNLE